MLSVDDAKTMYDAVVHRVKCKKITVAFILFTLIFGTHIATKISNYSEVKTEMVDILLPNSDVPNVFSKNRTKNILIWSDRNVNPMKFFYRGRTSFHINRCNNTNCYVTDNRGYLKDIVNFDAVLFNGKTISDENFGRILPKRRSTKQKYVFAATEAAQHYPVTLAIFNDYFNWTWTYRLDSDLRWNYFTIHDLNGNLVGPAINMKWPKMKPVTDEVKAKLKYKKRAVAWIESDCIGERHIVASNLEQELAQLYLHVNIYGKCGYSKWPGGVSFNNCHKVLQSDYYFYLAFENSFAEDYVTNKVLMAFDNYVVPIVYGGADYSRFLPPGSYIRATMDNAKEVAAKIKYLMSNRKAYEDYFRWRNHFVFKQSVSESALCEICNALNDEKFDGVSVKKNFLRWWNVDKSFWTD